jgi:FKBP-type peptidyl-prolyl cis-trans isomerase FklB
MKSYIISSAAIALLAVSAPGQDKLDLKDSKARISYCIGVDIGSSFKDEDINIDPKVLAAGIADALANKVQLTKDEMKETLTNFQKQMMDQMEQKDKAALEKNAKEGEKFLAENAKKEGVKVTASGLQYKVIKSGTGKTPKSTDTVKTHYHGTLIDGTVFDSSVDRKEPVTFPVNGVIPGWTEALQLMKEGDKWQLFVPSKLAYGEEGAGSKIGPNTTLIFEVELISIETSDTPKK